jgi:hypothetical protein
VKRIDQMGAGPWQLPWAQDKVSFLSKACPILEAE